MKLSLALALCAAAPRAALAQGAPPAPLLTYYSAKHLDNAVVSTPAAIASLDASYAFVTNDLYVQSNAPGAGLAPLGLYFCAAAQHHITTASATGVAYAAANNCSLVGVQGYVYLTAEAAGARAAPLEMWYSSARGDYFLVGTAQNRENAQGAHYELLYVDSYVGQQWVAWPNSPPTQPSVIPFPPSPDLVGYSYQLTGNAVTPGIGADTWYPSWSTSGKMYSSWTDGVVDGVHSGSGGGAHAMTGFAIIEGDDPFNLTLSGVATYHESALPYQGRYPSLCYHYNGVWYYGTYSLDQLNGPCGNWCVQGPFTSIRTSTDEGATWTDSRQNMTSRSDNLFGEIAYNRSKVKFGAPHAIDFGQNGQHSPDGAMYIVGHGAQNPDSNQSWMQGDSVYMARTVGPPSPATVNTAAAWEFYAGGHGAGAAWSPSLRDAVPLIDWPTRTGVVTMSFHPALQKYILVVSTPTVSPSTVKDFDTYMLESDDLTGPWAYVTYMPAFGPEAYFVHIPSKFMAGSVVAAAAPGAGAVASAAPGATAPGASAVLPLRAQEAAEQAQAAGQYEFFLSYSADFASGVPNPPGSGYHWSLLQSRIGVTGAHMARLAAQGRVQQ